MAYIPCRIGGGAIINIPNGKTVTPTDDIQTWLHCAGVFDNNYTTLAQILADTSVFTTLLADSNACDYMARSTTWADAEGTVPTMTDNTHPSGECIGQNYVNNGYYLSFNGSTSTSDNAGAVTNQVNGFAVGYHFDEPIKLYRARYWNRETTPTYGVADHKYQGSNDGTNWIDLTNTLTMSNPNSTTPCDEIINSETAYSYIRLYVINAWDNASTTNKQTTYCNASELQFYEIDITHSQNAMASIGKYDYCSNALLSNATWAEAIGNSDYFEKVLNVKVPVMTSDTTPYGIATTNANVSSGKNAYSCFDNNTSTYAAISSGSLWVCYQFTAPVCINKVGFITYERCNSFEIQADNGDDNFVTIYEGVAENKSDYQYFEFNNDESYLRWRMLINSTHQNNATIWELQFYGRHEVKAGIIHCATNDVITITGNGVTKTVYANGNEGVLPLDLKSGLYTFTSSIAKNPANLSENYSKNILITDYTTDVYLMPDPVKTLYWWGYVGDNLEICNTANGWTNSSWTWIDPIFNSNNINLKPNGSSSSTYTSGVGTKNSVSGTLAKAIVQGISELSGSYGDLRTMSSKNYSNPLDSADIQSTSIMLYDSDISQNSHITVNSTRSRNSTLYALWYD